MHFSSILKYAAKYHIPDKPGRPKLDLKIDIKDNNDTLDEEGSNSLQHY